jgi:putative nucleotidyltransferase with HDIG domain
MAVIRNPSPRRREVRRTLSRHRANLPTWLNARTVTWAVTYAVAIAMFATLIAPSPSSPTLFHEGRILREAVVPRVEFKAIDSVATERRREEAFHFTPAVYVPNEAFFEKVRKGLENLINLGADNDIVSIDQIPLATQQNLMLTDSALRQLKYYNDSEEQRAAWDQLAEQFVTQQLPNIVILEHERYEIELDRSDRATAITIKHPTDGELLQRDGFGYYDVEGDPNPVRNSVTTQASKFPLVLKRSIIATVMQEIHQPTYLLDEEVTHQRREAASQAEPVVEANYRPNTVLIPSGTKLNDAHIELLHKEHEAYLTYLGPQRELLMWVARFGIMALIGTAIWAYILAFNRTISRNPVRGVALTALVLACQAGAVYATEYKPEFMFGVATFPTLLVAMILAITYDQRFALAIGAMHAMLVTVSLNLPIHFVVMALVGVALAVAQLNEVRTRSKLVTVGFVAGLGMAITALITGMTSPALAFDDGIRQVCQDAVIALGGGALAGVFVQAMLPFVERLFKVTTSMRLKELNETTLPLLRRLAEEAPGTYQHSLRIADMAEGAAEAIGADGLLCRVGAMYHDIGKINKPMYFVENQAGGPNRHTKLSPAMSLLIIVGHVKDGIEMAREYGLPPAIRHFIESHHGTTLVEYFYHAAREKQQKDAKDEPAPPEFSFRYPGPKPQTKEAAILMICDGVEATARALPEPNAVRIEQVVRAMANKRLMDGQFDECNLTLQELHRIEQAIIRTLTAIYHGRVKYPEQERAPRKETTVAAS